MYLITYFLLLRRQYIPVAFTCSAHMYILCKNDMPSTLTTTSTLCNMFTMAERVGWKTDTLA